MFPWSSEFVWDATHIAFFGAFYAVLAVVAVFVLTAAHRTRRHVGRAEVALWSEDFQELSATARACRHQLTGEAPGRTCDHGFDCRDCGGHADFVARTQANRAPCGESVDRTVEQFGLAMPLDRLYHRGHTWAHPEADGTVTVGLDALGKRLLDSLEGVSLPKPGSRLVVNGTVCRVSCRGAEVRILSPVEGEVVEACGDGTDFELRIRPEGPIDVRHLLEGDEVRPWMLREVERLERALATSEVGLALADGGEIVADLGRVLPARQFDAVLAEVFLDR